MNKTLKTGYARIVFRNGAITYCDIESIDSGSFTAFDIWENKQVTIKFKDCKSVENCDEHDVPAYE